MREERDYLYWEFGDPKRESFRFNEDGLLVEVLSGVSSHIVKWARQSEGGVKDSR